VFIFQFVSISSSIFRTRRSCQKYAKIFFKFCGLLRKPKLYKKCYVHCTHAILEVQRPVVCILISALYRSQAQFTEHDALVKSTAKIIFQILWPSQKIQTLQKVPCALYSHYFRTAPPGCILISALYRSQAQFSVRKQIKSLLEASLMIMVGFFSKHTFYSVTHRTTFPIYVDLF
jgi:hypothetical protein